MELQPLPLRYLCMNENEGEDKRSRPSASRALLSASAAAEASLTLTELILVQLRENGSLLHEDMIEGLESALQSHLSLAVDPVIPEDARGHHEHTAEIIRSVLTRQRTRVG